MPYFVKTSQKKTEEGALGLWKKKNLFWSPPTGKSCDTNLKGSESTIK